MSFLQLPTTAAPSSFTQLPLLWEVRMSTPYCWHHSLARVRYVVHPFAVQLSTSHVATTASKPAYDHTYPLLVQQLGYTTAYDCLPFLYILAAISTLENVHLYWYW